MKKLLSVILAVVMTLAFAGCGSAPVTLASVTTAQGVTISLPSDMVKKSDVLYGSDKGDALSTQTTPSDPSTPLSAWDAEAVKTLYGQTYTEVTVTSFEKDKTINGNTGFYAFFTAKTKDGQDRGGAIVMLTNGTNDYIFNLLYRGDNAKGSLATNIQACIDSIQLPTK
ncbi:MAG: hypothetical protein Q8898_17475 [Bacillota bacterium]|nr:hypothetical protein [Bacillota bacterium]